MKILVIEDRFDLFESQFHFINTDEFGSKFEFTNIRGVEASTPIDFYLKFDGIVLDIELEKSSARDGYGVLKQLSSSKFDIRKLVILTGHSFINEKLNEIGLPKVAVVKKPVGFDDVRFILRKFSG